GHSAVPSPLFAVTETPPVLSQEPNPAPASSLYYVSDYFSFVGKDTQGHVAFAIDTNRGRDGDQWQAEHFVVLHDERHGWIDVQGSGSYDNANHELFTIPDSPSFQFGGIPSTGIIITSTSNSLVLTVMPLLERISRKHDDGVYWLGSAQATLQWRGRTLEGRVIYEYLSKPDFNRLTRTYWGLWNNFQGFYLSLEGVGDLYLHRSEGEMMAALTGKQEAFAVLDTNEISLPDISITTRARTFAPGFYRWPTQWDIQWRDEGGQATVRLDTVHFKRVANWVIGGFAMSIVQGELYYGGQSYSVYGFAELLM
ncbi:MAG: hypothetical protein VST68_01320, partial [Nitrospirota bacterium]|nr:hypothetical protein [Nitrospirota bacterium]